MTLEETKEDDTPIDWRDAALKVIRDYCEDKTDSTARFCYGAAFMALYQTEQEPTQ